MAQLGFQVATFSQSRRDAFTVEINIEQLSKSRRDGFMLLINPSLRDLKAVIIYFSTVNPSLKDFEIQQLETLIEPIELLNQSLTIILAMNFRTPQYKSVFSAAFRQFIKRTT